LPGGTATGITIADEFAYVADGEAGLQIIGVDDPSSPVLIGFYPTMDYVTDVAVQGNHAYVTERYEGLKVLDVSNRAEPELVGSFKMSVSTQYLSCLVDDEHVFLGTSNRGLRVIDVSDLDSIDEVGDYQGLCLSDMKKTGVRIFSASREDGLIIFNVSDPGDPRIDGRYDFTIYYHAHRVAIQDNEAFMAVDMIGNSMIVLNFSNIDSIVEVGQNIPTTDLKYQYGDAHAIAVKGDRAYIGFINYGIKVVDISILASVYEINHHENDGSTTDVFIHDDIAHVTGSLSHNSSGLFETLDISDLSNIIELDRLTFPGPCWAVMLKQNFAYIAGRSEGMWVINVSDPTNLKVEGKIENIGDAWDIDISGDFAYLSDFDGGGMVIVNISIPAEPTLAGSYDTTGKSMGIKVDGPNVYLADKRNFRVINITNPDEPKQILSQSSNYFWGFQDVAVNGKIAVVANDEQIRFYNISDPTDIKYYYTWASPKRASRVSIFDSYCYVYEESIGYRVFDISIPEIPITVGQINIPSSASFGMSIVDDVPIISVGYRGIYAYDISQLAEIKDIGVYRTNSSVRAVKASSEYTYFVDYCSGLHIIEVDGYDLISEVGSYDPKINRIRDFTVVDNYAYLARYYGLEIVDISDPRNPEGTGEYDTPDVSFDIEVAGDYAYIADQRSGLRIVDISNPETPDEVGHFETDEVAIGVDVEDDYAYVAVRGQGFHIIDISDPADPAEITRYSIDQSAYDVTVEGRYAYVAHHNGLEIVDVSDPEQPFTTDEIDIYNSDCQEVVLYRDYAIVAAGYAGVVIVDVTNVSDLAMVGQIPIPSYAEGVAFDDMKVYVAAKEGGMQVYSIHFPPRAFIESISPEWINQGETVNLVGSGSDVDGEVIDYHWRSDLDGELETLQSVSTDSLSPGFHTISLMTSTLR